MANPLEIFHKLTSNPDLMAKVKATKSPEDIVALAKENGIDITVDEVKKALAEKEKYAGLLSHLKL